MEDVTRRVRADYDQWGDAWRQKVWIDDADFENEIRAFSELPRVETMLDVATGGGDFGAIFDADITVGADLSSSMLASCRQHHPDILTAQATGEALPFRDGAFDQVVSRNFLQNLTDHTAGFDEMLRVLKPGGRLLIMESAVFDGEEIYPIQVARVAEPYHLPFPTHEGVRHLFTQSGVVDVEQEVIGIKRKWLGKWVLSKGVSEVDRRRIYQICSSYPEEYQKKYDFEFFPDEGEISSRLTFSIIKGRKPTIAVS